MTILNINNKKHELDLKGNETLLEVLRDNLALTGTKSSCEEAECGSCTVLINGTSRLACITLACDVEGDEILTIEGLSDGNKLHTIQEAFLEKGAVQCGFCIPGMVLSSKSLLDKNLSPTRDEIKEALDGNLCRCAGYQKIFDAVEYAAEILKEKNK